MPDKRTLSRSVLRRAENTELSLGSLEAIAEIRGWLDRMEHEAMLSAREKGATMEDIAAALGLTAQAIHHRLRNGDGNPQIGRGRPKNPSTEP
jgi:predicted transcriptional regulator